jgi:membrane fusion protein (multidrug efflux system)
MTKRAVIIPLIVIGVALALLFSIKNGWSSWQAKSREPRTDDAFIRADLTPLSTRIAGTVRSVDVGDYESVKEGQLLIELNDTDYQAIVDQAKAALAAAQAALDSNASLKRVQDAQIQNAQNGIAAAIAGVKAAEAAVAATQPDVDRTQAELKRTEALLNSKAATHQNLEQAMADAQRFTGSLAAHAADVERAKASLASSQTLLIAAQSERAALDIKDELYRADIQAKRSAITVAKVNLAYTKIAAPTAGAVGERHVQPGQLVGPGTEVIALVKGDVWIQANFKETQLTNVRRGDPVDVRVDAFPNSPLHGKVVEIAPASGSQFALLPPDNATGNFTKVVQRIPVKIVLDEDHPLRGELRPGFSAEVTIHASAHPATSEGSAP